MTKRRVGQRTRRALARVGFVAAAGAVPLPVAKAQHVRPVLAFPEAGLDDSAAYAGYQTRLFRDAAGNTIQVYLDERQARVVHVLADAENESVGLSARGADGQPVVLRWGSEGATAGRAGRTRTLTSALVAAASAVRLDQFLLGSMRVERDFQYFQGQRRPFASQPVAEVDSLVATLGRLAPAERARHLAVLHAPSVAALRARLRPTVTAHPGATAWTAHVVQPSLDGRDTLAVDITVDPRAVVPALTGDTLTPTLTLRARGGAQAVPFTVRVATTGRALTPLTRRELFTPAFLDFATAEARRATGSARTRLLERQIRSVELLASREKLMAGLPTYATYFGRDMMVSALMMRAPGAEVWRPEVAGFVVASVLRNLAPDGQVSHEEALGGQAVREGAAEYARLLAERARADGAGEQARAARLLDSARAVLRDLRVTRQNYHMVDDELQLVVLAGRYLRDPAVSAAAKRAFLADARDSGEPRVTRLVRELALVARMTAPYARTRAVADLVSFPVRDTVDGRVRYFAASWRDSGVGYAYGRFAWDVNAIWAPHALEAMGQILATLRELGYGPDALARLVPGAAAGTPLGTYARDPQALAAVVAAWRDAGRHFVVRLGPDEVRARVAARVAASPEAERAYWTARVAESRADADSLVFDAVALDAAGQPIGVANTDGATRLFLGDAEGLVPDTTPAADAAAHVRRDVAVFSRAYPVGLLVDRVGPVVSNDTYATPDVWRAFAEDLYHSPRVVWGREVNLFLLGVADRLPAAGHDAAELRSAMERVRSAADAAGFRSELWSYEFRDGRPAAMRYGSGNDLQLWTTTDLAVQYVLSRLGGR